MAQKTIMLSKSVRIPSQTNDLKKTEKRQKGGATMKKQKKREKTKL